MSTPKLVAEVKRYAASANSRLRGEGHWAGVAAGLTWDAQREVWTTRDGFAYESPAEHDAA